MSFLQKNQIWLVGGIYFLLCLCYMIWSFAITDPNLVFSTWPPFWSFQQMMWQVPKEHITIIYGILISWMFICSIWLSKLVTKTDFQLKQLLVLFILLTFPLVFSNNALSHDVFNYIFNARMVVKYQVNPHVRVAMDFMYDPWTRFMNNIHTPAPYFYGWTALSVIPYLLGFEKFVLTWILFRLWSELGLILSFIFVWLIAKKSEMLDKASFVLILFNPLLILEMISNSHNDGWLIWPALASFYLLISNTELKKIRVMNIAASLLLLLLSMSTKYVTVLLLPVWLALVASESGVLRKAKLVLSKLSWVQLNAFDVSAVLLFLPLLTARSQQFHPWYLSWSLLFYPLMKNRFLRFCLIVLSLSSLYRYTPWMWNGAFHYTDQIELNEKLITWVPVVVFGLMWYFIDQYNASKKID